MRAYKPLFEAREVQGSSLTQIACALWLIKDVRLSNKVKRGGGGGTVKWTVLEGKKEKLILEFWISMWS